MTTFCIIFVAIKMVSHRSQASSRSSQSQQQAATWLRSPCLFTYSQQHNVSASSSRHTLLTRFFITDSPDSLSEETSYFWELLEGGGGPTSIVGTWHHEADSAHICHPLMSELPTSVRQSMTFAVIVEHRPRLGHKSRHLSQERSHNKKRIIFQGSLGAKSAEA